ncbi:MAG: TIM barrel protein [Chitinivibrionales bacterium]|nr:TIM barrel protein [Chitinivibrionales bacterium]
MRIGLKLWSTDEWYVQPAQELFKKKVFDYIELFTEPNSFKHYGSQWKDIGIPFVLHAPHSMQDFNLSLQDHQCKNKTYCEEIQLYVKLLHPDFVIFHPGIIGTAQETVRQINLLKIEFPDIFKKALLENKPKIGLNHERCIGADPEELKEIIEQTQTGFCLDFGHAICYAASEGLDYQAAINRFLQYSPSIFHLYDGLTTSFNDGHMHLGTGNFDLSWLVENIPHKASVTIETIKNSKTGLKDFEIDVAAFRKIRYFTLS